MCERLNRGQLGKTDAGVTRGSSPSELADTGRANAFAVEYQTAASEVGEVKLGSQATVSQHARQRHDAVER